VSAGIDVETGTCVGKGTPARPGRAKLDSLFAGGGRKLAASRFVLSVALGATAELVHNTCMPMKATIELINQMQVDGLDKSRMRARLASLSFSDKIRILEKLRDRSKAIATSGLRKAARTEDKVHNAGNKQKGRRNET
jgi:hypothetical protein